MPRDITRQKFGRLLAIEPTEEIRNESRVWLCWCECGNEKRVLRKRLLSGDTRSCGCFRTEQIERAQAHGTANSRAYNAWYAMNRRCTNTLNSNYRYYGGRGITVCARWRDSYANFFTDMGRKPSEKHSLDRIDNDGDYSPENCRWATASKQMSNTRRTIRIKIAGKTRTSSEWLEHFGLKRKTYENRVNKGWSRVEALSRPVRKRSV